MTGKYTPIETDEYERLVHFFVENQLEFDGDEEVDTDIIRCYKIEEESPNSNKNHSYEPTNNPVVKTENLVGAAVLVKREGRYICDGIAVNPKYRNEGIGEILLNKLLEYVKELEGDGLYLVARAPGFFRKNGFEEINPEDAPNFFECKYCPQYQKTCFPEIMKYKF